VAEKIRAQLLLPEALLARPALRHRVTPAVPEKQYAFLAAQIAGSLAVEMHHATGADADGIIWPDRLKTSRALRISHCGTALKRGDHCTRRSSRQCLVRPRTPVQ